MKNTISNDKRQDTKEPGIFKRRGVVLTPKDEPEYKKGGEFGTYNPTAAIFDGKEIRLLYRFARRLYQKDLNIRIDYNNNNTYIDYSDLRLAVSTDGLKGMKFQKKGVVFKASGKKEMLGVEDPRSQLIIGKNKKSFHLISYVRVDKIINGNGKTSIGLLTTTDFKRFKRMGHLSNVRKKDGKVAFGDKDVVFFPNKVGGRYWALRRPDFDGFDGKEKYMTLVSNKSLFRGWDIGKKLFQSNDLPKWAQSHTGAGTQPIEIMINGERKWLEIAHGVEKRKTYIYKAMGLIFGEKNGKIVLEHLCKKSLLEPTTKYEKNGLISSVVFPTAAILVENTLKVYYGAGDGVIALIEGDVNEIAEYIMKNSIKLQ